MELQVYNDQEKQKAIDIINMLDYPIKVKVDNIYKQRTIPQNRYYHLIKKQCADHLGLTPDEMHNMFLKMFALVEEKIIDGQKYYLVESTAEMDRKRIEDYLENIRRWMMSEHQYYVSLPNETFDDIDETKLKLIK